MSSTEKTPYGPNPLGRIYIPDKRDDLFPMAAAVPQTSERTSRYWWQDGWWGDQLATPQCVAYSWLHWVEDGPRTVAPYVPQRKSKHREGAVLDPVSLYNSAQRVDSWPGENYAGTSVRAGAKVLKERGYISAYTWARSLDDVVKALLEVGPVVVGTTWYSGMSRPDSDGFLNQTGVIEGGHAYLLNGVNTTKRTFRVKNSWGRLWGKNGTATLAFEDFSDLLDQNGEACLPVV